MSSNPKWTAYLRRMRRTHGAEWAADERFVPYFRTLQRIKVRYGGDEITGTVTGTSEGIVLRRRLNSRKGDVPLGPEVELVAELHGNFYRPIEES